MIGSSKNLQDVGFLGVHRACHVCCEKTSRASHISGMNIDRSLTLCCHRESWLQQLIVLGYCSQRESRCHKRQRRKQTWKCINPEKTNVRPLPPNTHQTHSVSLYELQDTWQSGATHQAMASWATSLCSCWDYVPMSSCSPMRSRCPSQKPLLPTRGPSFLVASFSSYAVNFRSDLHS